MKSLGEMLSAAREARGYTLEHVARETNIARKYLAALEAEDFSQFSAAAYEIGFLRNYGEFLGLDTKELLDLYRVLKIQEQTVPMEQLLKMPSPLPKILLIAAIILAAAGGVGAGVYYILFKQKPAASPPELLREPVQYTLSENYFEQRFYINDTVLIPVGSNTYKLTLARISEMVTVDSPLGSLVLGLGLAKDLDLNADGTVDLSIVTIDFTPNSPKQGALLRLEMSAAPGGGASAFSEPEAGPSLSASSTSVSIFESNSAYPFTLQVTFQAYCMFRWEILREANRGRTENYFSRGQDLSVQAQNGVRVWVSNAGALKAQVIGGGQTSPITLGSAGEVVVADIQWVRDESGRYRLLLQKLES